MAYPGQAYRIDQAVNRAYMDQFHEEMGDAGARGMINNRMYNLGYRYGGPALLAYLGSKLGFNYVRKGRSQARPSGSNYAYSGPRSNFRVKRYRYKRNRMRRFKRRY